jgi:long-chain acyl-CoA synthetase
MEKDLLAKFHCACLREAQEARALISQTATSELINALNRTFGELSALIRMHAAERPDSIAMVDDASRLTWRELNTLMDRCAVALQREGVRRGEIVALLGVNSAVYAAVYLAIIRVGAVAAPLPTSATPASIGAMIKDSGTRILFLDSATQGALDAASIASSIHRIVLDDGVGGTPLHAWLAEEGSIPEPVLMEPSDPFNVIYSSGTTGVPKGIVQSHGMRWGHITRGIEHIGYASDAVTLLSTPLYSNTTLAAFAPAVGAGGRTVLMAKFEARRFLETAVRERATHFVLVPVQYRRILSQPDFDSFDLTSSRTKTSTSAPFPAELKAAVLRRWPGRLIDVYGMTEGGGTCLLMAHEHPEKLHTVGRPGVGHDIRLIDEAGQEVPAGGSGEVVGRSGAMMIGYLNQPEKTREAEWYDSEGQRYIRHGDIGRFDEDGFLILLDRAKDMIISGGFNIYPSDLEAVLKSHPDVLETAVVAKPSEEWGETPVGFVVVRNAAAEPQAILAYANQNLGKTQRLAEIHVIDELPRSAIGKVLKRELRERVKNA